MYKKNSQDPIHSRLFDENSNKSQMIEQQQEQDENTQILIDSDNEDEFTSSGVSEDEEEEQEENDFQEGEKEVFLFKSNNKIKLFRKYSSTNTSI